VTTSVIIIIIIIVNINASIVVVATTTITTSGRQHSVLCCSCGDILHRKDYCFMFFNLFRNYHKLLYGCYHLYCCVVCSVTRRVVVVTQPALRQKKSPFSVELVMTVHNRPYAERKMTVLGHK
jgi:hypothetical protein